MDDPVVAADLERTPDLLGGLETGWYLENGAAGRYQFAVDLEGYLATPGIAGSPMAAAMHAAVDLPDQGLRALPDVAGVIRRIREFLRLRQQQVTGQQQFELLLTAYEMWIPPVPGATGSVTMATSESGTGSISFKILGVGGGPAFEQTITLELSRTDIPRSERLELALTGIAEQVEVTRAGRVEARYVRLANLSGVPVHRFRPLAPQANPPAGLGAETVFRVALRRGDGAATFTLKLAGNRSWSMSYAPRLDALATEIGISYVHKASQALSFDYRLPEGYEYTAAELLDRPAISWVAIPAGAG
jgi:hypothetical protein